MIRGRSVKSRGFSSIIRIANVTVYYSVTSYQFLRAYWFVFFLLQNEGMNFDEEDVDVTNVTLAQQHVEVLYTVVGTLKLVWDAADLFCKKLSQ